MPQDIKINNGQTLIDAVVQHLGDASLVMQSALNNNVSITEGLSNVVLGDADISKAKTVEQMSRPYNLPASDDNIQQGEGIGFWRIGVDFKISKKS